MSKNRGIKRRESRATRAKWMRTITCHCSPLGDEAMANRRRDCKMYELRAENFALLALKERLRGSSVLIREVFIPVGGRRRIHTYNTPATVDVRLQEVQDRIRAHKKTYKEQK